MNPQQARFNMVEQQVRTWQVFDPKVLDLQAALPREKFVPPAYQSMAFADTSVPLGHGQQMMPPREEGRMLQALEVLSDDIVLEVGTGSGYVTAMLASLARQVYSVDIIPEFITEASTRLQSLGLTNVKLEVADAASGWEHYGPYDVIAITGGLYFLPENFRHSLKVGGRLFCMLGKAPVMTATLFIYHGEDEWEEISLYETLTPHLINAPQPSQFEF